MREKIFSTVLFCVLSAASATFASGARDCGDAALLDKFAQNGTLTENESLKIKKSIVDINTDGAVSKNVVGFRLPFYIQPYFYTVDQSFSGAGTDIKYSTSSATIRRLLIVPIFDLTDSVQYLMSVCMTSKPVLLDNCVLSKKIDSGWFTGKLKGGYFTVPLSMERLESGSRLLTIERSINSNYWGGGDWNYADGYRSAYNSRLCISDNHAGVLWEGEIQTNRDFKYGLGITNSQGMRIEPEDGNDLSYLFYMHFDGYVDGKTSGDWHVFAGINLAYANKLMGVISPAAITTDKCVDYAETFAWNPFIFVKYKENSQIKCEFFGNYMAMGKTRRDDKPWYTTKSDAANPFGFTFTVAHRIDTEFIAIRPAARLAWIWSDGRGINPSEVHFGLASKDGLYKDAFEIYCGIDWLFNNDDAKLSTGYSRIEFYDSPTGGAYKDSIADLVAVQITLRF